MLLQDDNEKTQEIVQIIKDGGKVTEDAGPIIQDDKLHVLKENRGQTIQDVGQLNEENADHLIQDGGQLNGNCGQSIQDGEQTIQDGGQLIQGISNLADGTAHIIHFVIPATTTSLVSNTGNTTLYMAGLEVGISASPDFRFFDFPI